MYLLLPTHNIIFVKKMFVFLGYRTCILSGLSLPTRIQYLFLFLYFVEHLLEIYKYVLRNKVV